jgi:FkbM family methyltransferase
MFSFVRSFGKRYPKLRAALSPAWRQFTQLLWILRKEMFGRWPITFTSRTHTISMMADGQIAECIWRGAFEQCERDFAAKEIKPGMRVLNIGANAGLYSIIASKMVGPDGIVHAFEPSLKNFTLLRKNVELNGCKNIVQNNLALWNSRGSLSLNFDPLHPGLDGHFFVRGLAEDSAAPSSLIEVVSCTTLDDYWRDACGGDIKPVDFIIMDVEGAELAVLEGARHTFAASPALIMIMECIDHISEVGAFLREFGFACYQFDFDSCRLQPAEIAQGSFIAMRQERHS